MSEFEFVKKFIDDLVNKYGYPKEAIKQEIKIGNVICDIAIKKGTKFIQVFELKKTLMPAAHIVLQRLSDVQVETPCFLVIFDDNGTWKLYDANNPEKEIIDKANVLNYGNATTRLINKSLNDITPILKKIANIGEWSASVLLFYLLAYGICYYKAGAYSSHYVRIPLSFEIITCFGIIIILLLLPYLLDLLKCIRRLKIGAFELELKEELGL